MLADRECASVTCHEKLMHFFSSLTQEVTTTDVTHRAPFLGTGIPMLGKILVEFAPGPLAEVLLQFPYINIHSWIVGDFISIILACQKAFQENF